MAGAGYYAGRLKGLDSLSERMSRASETQARTQEMQFKSEDQNMQRQRFPNLLAQDKASLENSGLERIEKQLSIRRLENEAAKEEYENNLIRNMQAGTSVANGQQEMASGDKQLAEQNRKMGTAIMKVDPLKAKKYFDAADSYESAAVTKIKTSLEIKAKQIDQAGQILANVDSQEALNEVLPELATYGVIIPPEMRDWSNPKTRDWITKQALRSPTIAKDLQDQVGFLDEQDKLEIDRQKNEVVDEQKYNRSLRERASQIKATSGTGSKQSAINERFNDRVINAGRLATESIDNIAKLPLQKTSYGGFKTDKLGLLSATKDALVNKVTPSDNQIYDKLMAGVERNLATLETFGIAPPVSFSKSFEKLKAQPNDTVKTRLINLAEMRQIIETSLSGFKDKSNVPEAQKIAIEAMIEKTRKAVPYTVDDIIKLDSDELAENYTLGNLIREQGVQKPTKGFEDAEKEKRYQEWKAKQGKK